MKKYVKPALIVERYELSQSIADCAWELNNQSTTSCKAKADLDFFGQVYEGVTLFTKSLECTFRSDDGYQDYCYQNGGSSPFTVFKS